MITKNHILNYRESRIHTGYKKSMQGAFNSALTTKPHVNLLISILMQAKIDSEYKPIADTLQERELIANAGEWLKSENAQAIMKYCAEYI